ncbi:FRG domain-containing protein [Fibrisoma montanum]|uniref:FRG domain-containing protein n=1 Tax=Fibrisoma montanum TaxID=2305895 RepID=A0A418M8Q6_9BACT|nr:FRG domain-containing protein [Fibrisoma montanum]RIV22470.1 FRG domain-containing protein [Fibrisoma montanum]
MESCVSSWNELMNCLYEESWMADIQRFRSPYAFRGMPDDTYTLTTSLMRLGPGCSQFEGHLLRNFKKYATRDVLEHDSFWHWLAVAQHHGLPTRLMDWTFSPLVALHFVTSDPILFDRDGAVWCINYKKVHQFLPESLTSTLHQEGADVFTVELLNDIQSLEEFDRLSEEKFALFFEPPSIDDRIVNQYALFSVVSSPELPLDEWLDSHDDMYRKIIIPAGLKWEIRDKLDQANINERVLFPGLDGLSSWLRRQYMSPLRPVREDPRQTPSLTARYPAQ